MGKNETIRVIALAVLRQNDHLFVTEYFHPATGKPYYRPLGGGVDFFETGETAVRRELLEEIRAPLTHVSYLATLENMFTLDGQRGHQICLMYEATFAESDRNQLDYVASGQEGILSFQAMWKPLSIFRNGDSPLYPDGLLELLDAKFP